MIIQTILAHKVAAVGAALVLGTTSVAVAATGNVPFLSDDDPVVEVVEATGEEAAEEAPPETGEPVSDTDADEATDEADRDGEGEETAGGEPPAADGSADDVVATGREDEVLPPVNEEGEPYGDVPCEDARNHGDYVSGVARDDSIEGNRGEIVSQAAQTSCGKRDAEMVEATGTESEEDEDGAADRDDDGDRP